MSAEVDTAAGECKDIYLDVARMFPTDLGKSLSRRERDEQCFKQPTLVYGEVTYDTLAIVFDKIKNKYGKPYNGDSGPDGFLQRPGGKFVDLGSGTGKPVFAAAVLHNFELCVGIELLESLYKVSLDLVIAYDKKVRHTDDNDLRTLDPYACENGITYTGKNSVDKRYGYW
jgi:Histone methylation protein DOT1